MDRDEAKIQQELLVEVVRCIQLKRVLSATNPDPEMNFWRLFSGGMLDLSVIDWCKIFGANGEPTHWKGLVSDPDKFRNDMLLSLEIDEKEWSTYWNHMKSYRDEFVAHHQRESKIKTYPVLDIAFKSSCFYYDHLARELASPYGQGLDGKLEEYAQRFYDQAKEVAVAASQATNGFKECVL